MSEETPSVEHATGHIETDDGETLFWQNWQMDAPRAVLLFVHGLAEHSGRYDYPVDYFVGRGFACWALDLRGHGQSSGRRVHVRSFEEYSRDVGQVFELLRQQHQGLPVVIVGHSMGGLIALRFFLDHQDDLEGAMLSSPALGTHPDLVPPRWLQTVARLLSRLAPGMLFPSEVDPKLICRNDVVVEKYRNDSLVGSKVSAGWFTAIEAAMAEMPQRAREVRKPILLMQSGADRLVDPQATRQWAERAPTSFVEHVEWPGFFHEMFNEPERQQVFEKMSAWLAERHLG